MAESKIEWTEMTWNPTTGCNKISAGCKFCYAEVMSKRLKAMGQVKYKNNFKLTLHPSSLNVPYTWNKPKVVFVNSMSDLFHKDVPLEYIQTVFKVMNDCPQHTFQVLTKRADILAQHSPFLNWTENIWMGVSVENLKVVDRIDHLRNTGAFIKFLSLEPLIGPLPDLNLFGIDWVIAGGESGPKARPMKTEWVIDIKDQCKDADVAFFFKQWGGKNKKKAGRLLEDRTYDEMPSKAGFGEPVLV
jgi:protein gp37